MPLLPGGLGIEDIRPPKALKAAGCHAMVSGFLYLDHRAVSALSDDQKTAVVSALCEGVSIRSTERLLNIHRDTIMRLGVKVGQGCAAIHGKLMVGLRPSRIELDEVWSFVKKKNKNITDADGTDVGDQFIYMAIDSTGKAILTWLIGKRSTENTETFLKDLRTRVIGAPEFSTDGYQPYEPHIDVIFDPSSHGIVNKKIIVELVTLENGDKVRERRGEIIRTPQKGVPKRISTSFIERQNLSLRMGQRRLTRRTNGFSKKYEHHCAAVALYVAHYNFCRVHETLQITPALHLGITDHVWSVSELVNAALTGELQGAVQRHKERFRVIEGGRK